MKAAGKRKALYISDEKEEVAAVGVKVESTEAQATSVTNSMSAEELAAVAVAVGVPVEQLAKCSGWAHMNAARIADVIKEIMHMTPAERKTRLSCFIAETHMDKQMQMQCQKKLFECNSKMLEIFELPEEYNEQRVKDFEALLESMQTYTVGVAKVFGNNPAFVDYVARKQLAVDDPVSAELRAVAVAVGVPAKQLSKCSGSAQAYAALFAKFINDFCIRVPNATPEENISRMQKFVQAHTAFTEQNDMDNQTLDTCMKTLLCC